MVIGLVDLHGDGREGAERDKEGEEDGDGIGHDLQHHAPWIHLNNSGCIQAVFFFKYIFALVNLDR